MSSKAEILKVAKPILFNTDMVQAILDGRKTVTRRLPSKRIEKKYLDYKEYVGMVAPPGSTSLTEKQFYEQYSPYRPGDYLYVRETWAPLHSNEGSDKVCGYMYKADSPEDYWYGRWKPSIYMPKEAARIFLRVTDVRMERLQDMDKVEAIKEGIDPRCCVNLAHALTKYMKLLDSTIPKKDLDKYGWDANPWVRAVEFERMAQDEIR